MAQIPADIRPIIDRSKELLQEGRDEENREFLRAEMARRPDEPQLLFQAALSAESDDEELELARQSAALARDPDLLTRVGHLLLRLGDVDAARSAAKAAQPFFREGFTLEGEWAHLAATLLAERGEVDQAIKLMERIFAEDPEVIDLGHDLAELHLRQSNADRAREVVAEALTHSADHARLEVLRAALEDLQEPGEGTTAS